MSLKCTHAWHMVSTPAHACVAQMHPCLAHGKHTRPRACRSNAPMPGTCYSHPPTRVSLKCTHAWRMVSTPPHAHVFFLYALVVFFYVVFFLCVLVVFFWAVFFLYVLVVFFYVVFILYVLLFLYVLFFLYALVVFLYVLFFLVYVFFFVCVFFACLGVLFVLVCLGAGCLLLVVSCFLLVIACFLFVVGSCCFLFVVGSLLLLVCCRFLVGCVVAALSSEAKTRWKNIFYVPRHHFHTLGHNDLDIKNAKNAGFLHDRT